MKITSRVAELTLCEILAVLGVLLCVICCDTVHYNALFFVEMLFALVINALVFFMFILFLQNQNEFNQNNKVLSHLILNQNTRVDSIDSAVVNIS